MRHEFTPPLLTPLTRPASAELGVLDVHEKPEGLPRSAFIPLLMKPSKGEEAFNFHVVSFPR